MEPAASVALPDSLEASALGACQEECSPSLGFPEQPRVERLRPACRRAQQGEARRVLAPLQLVQLCLAVGSQVRAFRALACLVDCRVSPAPLEAASLEQANSGSIAGWRLWQFSRLRLQQEWSSRL